MTDNAAPKEKTLDSINAIKSDDVIVACTPETGCHVSISLGDEAIQAIKQLEQYAILAGHRIGEFRVG